MAARVTSGLSISPRSSRDKVAALIGLPVRCWMSAAASRKLKPCDRLTCLRLLTANLLLDLAGRVFLLRSSVAPRYYRIGIEHAFDAHRGPTARGPLWGGWREPCNGPEGQMQTDGFGRKTKLLLENSVLRGPDCLLTREIIRAGLSLDEGGLRHIGATSWDAPSVEQSRSSIHRPTRHTRRTRARSAPAPA